MRSIRNIKQSLSFAIAQQLPLHKGASRSNENIQRQKPIWNHQLSGSFRHTKNRELLQAVPQLPFII